MVAIPTAGLTPDNLPTFMRKQLGFRVQGDMELHIMAGQPVKVTEVLVAAATTTAATAAGFSAPDITKISTALTNSKIHK